MVSARWPLVAFVLVPRVALAYLTTRFSPAAAGLLLAAAAGLAVGAAFLPRRGREVLVAQDGWEVAGHVSELGPDTARRIGRAARRRALAEHTYAHRAVQVEQVLGYSSSTGVSAQGQVA